MVPVLLAACRAPPEPPPPQDYVRPADEPSPTVPLEDVDDAAAGAVAWFFAADPGDAIDAWTDAAAHGDPACPAYASPPPDFWWYGTCASRDGTLFDGSFYGTVYDPFDDGVYEYWDYATLNGDARVSFDDGQVLRLSGALYAYKTRAVGGPATGGYARWQGDASWEGGATAHTWLGDAPSFDYELLGGDDGSGVVTLTVQGGASHLSGRFTAVVFDGVAVDTAACAEEPTAGILRLAEASGEWWELVFDGGPCDGCGQAWFRGEHLGESCPDLGPMLRYSSGWTP